MISSSKPTVKAQISEMSNDYADWVKESITDLAQAHEDVKDSFGKAEEQMKLAMEKLNITAHELRGEDGGLAIR